MIKKGKGYRKKNFYMPYMSHLIFLMLFADLCPFATGTLWKIHARYFDSQLEKHKSPDLFLSYSDLLNYLFNWCKINEKKRFLWKNARDFSWNLISEWSILIPFLNRFEKPFKSYSLQQNQTLSIPA